MKVFLRTAFITFASLVLAFTATNAYAEGDAETGENLARELCAQCHDVERGGPFKQHPPSFASIAVYRSRKQIYGRMVFSPLHGNMPPLLYRLTPTNVENLVAYIVSLKEQ